MLKKLLYFQWISKRAKSFDLKVSTIKIILRYLLTPIIIFIFCLNAYVQVQSSAYVASIISKICLIVLVLQVILKKNIKDFRKDPILVFIKEERYLYIKRKVELSIYKSILLFIIPMLLPLIIYSTNKICILSMSFLLIINFYLFNMIIAYTVSYAESVSNKNILNKVLYILGVIIFIILLFVVQTYMVHEIINGLLGNGQGTFNIYSKINTMILTIVGVIGVGLYIMILNLVRRNLYVILNPFEVRKESKKGLSNKILKLKGNNLYKKMLIKDLYCFTKKKGIEFYIVILSQVSSFVFYCVTILQETPKVLLEKLNLVSIFYLICCCINVPILIGVISSNINEVKVDDEFGVLKKFNIKSDKVKILREKANYIFILLLVPIILMGLTNLLINISLGGLLQTILIVVSILSWIRYYVLFGIDKMNLEFNAIRFISFLGISAVGARIMIGISFLNTSENIKSLISKYLFVIFINILGYYIELILIKFLEKDEING